MVSATPSPHTPHQGGKKATHPLKQGKAEKETSNHTLFTDALITTHTDYLVIYIIWSAYIESRQYSQLFVLSFSAKVFLTL